MWILFAAGSVFFAGMTAVLAKCGMRRTDAAVAAAVRTIVVLIFSWWMVFLTGSQSQITDIPLKTLLFLILSGLTTGISWLCCFRALQAGDVTRVVSVDKSSAALTILLAFLLLHERLSIWNLAGILMIGGGTFLMIEKKDVTPKRGKSGWFPYAVGSAFFASLTSILGEIGTSGVDSSLAAAIRTVVALILSWVVVVVTGKAGEAGRIPTGEFLFICLSGLATGISWLCQYRALQGGSASVVMSMDKLSILVSVAASCLVLHERLSRKATVGLICILLGISMTA